MTSGTVERARGALPRVLRRDAWWVPLLPVILLLGLFGLYSTWAVLIEGRNFYAEPYLSPFASPCIAVATCEHVTIPIVGAWWVWSPGILILWAPLGFRATCYYYRKAYYKAFFLQPPACAIPDASRKYTGESKFPFILQNVHRYFFWFSFPILAALWYDSVLAFQFPEGLGIGVGTVILTLNAALLTLYTVSCHSCRHIVGGGANTFSRVPLLHGMWQVVTRLNVRHMQIAWVSLVWVGLTDLYVRLLAGGVIQDFRIIF